MDHLTLEQVRERVRVACKIGGQKQWADAHGVAPSYVSDVLSGRREPGGAILGALGLTKEVRYRDKGC